MTWFIQQFIFFPFCSRLNSFIWHLHPAELSDEKDVQFCYSMPSPKHQHHHFEKETVWKYELTLLNFCLDSSGPSLYKRYLKIWIYTGEFVWNVQCHHCKRYAFEMWTHTGENVSNITTITVKEMVLKHGLILENLFGTFLAISVEELVLKYRFVLDNSFGDLCPLFGMFSAINVKCGVILESLFGTFSAMDS